MVYIEEALEGVRVGRKITEYSDLSDAISAARSGINSRAYATQFEKDRDALVLAGQLADLAEQGDVQLSQEERLLKNAQEQLSAWTRRSATGAICSKATTSRLMPR